MDKYDEAVAFLENNPHAISRAWNFPSEPGGCLFRPACPDQSWDGSSAFPLNPQGKQVGCLTQIRDEEYYHAWSAPLTAEIRADKRIPCRPSAIAAEHLPVFAEWQRRLDKELGRKP